MHYIIFQKKFILFEINQNYNYIFLNIIKTFNNVFKNKLLYIFFIKNIDFRIVNQINSFFTNRLSIIQINILSKIL